MGQPTQYKIFWNYFLIVSEAPDLAGAANVLVAVTFWAGLAAGITAVFPDAAGFTGAEVVVLFLSEVFVFCTGLPLASINTGFGLATSVMST